MRLFLGKNKETKLLSKTQIKFVSTIFLVSMLFLSCDGKVKEGFYKSNLTETIIHLQQDEEGYRLTEVKYYDDTCYTIPENIKMKPNFTFVKNNDVYVDKERPVITFTKLSSSSFTIKAEILGKVMETEYVKFNAKEENDIVRVPYKAVEMTEELRALLNKHEEFGADKTLGFSMYVMNADNKQLQSEDDIADHFISVVFSAKNSSETRDILIEDAGEGYRMNKEKAPLSSVYQNKPSVYTNPDRRSQKFKERVYAFFPYCMPWTDVIMLIDEFTPEGANATILYDNDNDGRYNHHKVKFKKYPN